MSGAVRIDVVKARSAQKPVGRGPSSWPPQVAVNSPCYYGRCPPEHNHQHDPYSPMSPGFSADPDDLPPGWTAQHAKRPSSGELCPTLCILCWEAEADIREHACVVLAVLDP